MFAHLTNYLRSYRRQSGLTQSDVAFLLGSHDGAQVSRYEKGHHFPPLRTALAYSTILGVSLSDLFSGVQLDVRKDIVPRVKKLRIQLEKRRAENRATVADARKLRWIDERWPSVQNHSNSRA